MKASLPGYTLVRARRRPRVNGCYFVHSYTRVEMTRITDFGRKRTYLKAGFGDNGGFVDTNGEKRETDEQPVSETIGESTNSTKKRKRRKKSNAEAELDAEGGGKSSKELGRTPSTEGKKAKSGMKKERIHKKHDKGVFSEAITFLILFKIIFSSESCVFRAKEAESYCESKNRHDLPQVSAKGAFCQRMSRNT